MGSSEANSHLCFNSAKSSQLKWHRSKELILNAEDISDEVFNLVSIAEYDAAPENHYTIIQMIKCADKYDYFINFNRQRGITADDSEGDNIILVTRLPASTYADSTLIARLNIGEEYVTKALISGDLLAMQLKELLVDTSPLSAAVRINKYDKCKSDANCNDFDPCTTSQCVNYDRYGEGMCVYNHVVCDLCGTDVRVTHATNELTEYFSWRIEQTDKERIIMSSKANMNPNSKCINSKCLAYGSYKMFVTYAQNITSMSNVSYSLESSGAMIFGDVTNDYIDLEEHFTACKSDANCVDFDGCAIDICNETTRLCENISLNKTE